MPTLDPREAQVLLLETQPDIVPSAATVAPAALLRAIATVRQMCDALDLPLAASIVSVGPTAPTLVDELRGVEPVIRRAVSALGDDKVRELLLGSRRRLLAIGGVSSEIAVLHSTLDALEQGFEVHVLVDACGGLSARTEAAAMRRMEAAGAIPSNVSSFFTGLIEDMSSEAGGAVMGALAQLWSWDTGHASAS